MSDRRPTLGLAQILAAARIVYPERKIGTLKNRFRLVVACISVRRQLCELLARDDHRLLREEVAQYPETLGFVLWPYIHAGWSVTERFEALSQHRKTLHAEMAVLNVGRAGSMVVADLAALSPGLRLVVDRAPWCLREGDLVLSAFVKDQRLTTMAFSFGRPNGELVAYVGSVQGSREDSAQAAYRRLAKDLHRMRVRDFLIKCFQLLMFHVGVQRILCVPDDQRHHRHVYFSRDKGQKFRLNYDEVWREHRAAVRIDGFFELSLLPAVRPTEEIDVRHRALYRRRYAMMHQLYVELTARLATAAPSLRCDPVPLAQRVSEAEM